MRNAGIALAVGAHYHPGIEAIQDGDRTFLACPALCEEPFRYLVLDIDAAGGVESRVEALAMDPGLGLVDTHVHTQFAYCSENMDVARVLELAPLFGLAGIRFTEHSGHLYFSAREYPRSWEWGLGRARSEDRRLEEYLSALRAAGVPPARFGIEIDCCHNGAPLLESAVRGQCPFQVGAMHSLPGLRPGTTASPGTLRNEFLAILETFLASGMKILAHPFRVFRRGGTAIPDDLFGPTVRLLRAHGTAAELNFHTNEPPPEFVAMCLEERVPLTFGSDAHNLYEIGAFALHLDLLRRCGFSGAPREVLLDVEG
jgi:histidinol phosphatase-like PHP family hydrolase